MYPQHISASLGVKMLSSIFEQFVQENPVSVMARVLMERIFAPERMDSLFTKYASVQYQLFTAVFNRVDHKFSKLKEQQKYSFGVAVGQSTIAYHGVNQAGGLVGAYLLL